MLRFLRVLTLFLVSFLSFDVASWATTSSGFFCDASKTYVECDAGYYLSDCGSYRDGRTITRPAAGNSCKACPSATSSAYYECSGGAVCPKNMVENEFRIAINVPKTGTVFGFNMSASGVFYVNWGDNTVIQKIDRTGLTANTGYTHTYRSTGAKTITISGQATAYNDSSRSMPAINFYYGSDDTAKLANTSMIRSVSGSLGSVFGTLSTGKNPRFNHLFTGAVNLTSVPSTLFSGITGFATGGMFTGAFMNTGLTSIPDGLFAGISGDIKPYTFSSTFNGCRGLTSIPENLFGNISGSMQSYAFHQMFNGCAALTGRSAKINGQYVYDIWPSATATQVGEMYTNATRLADYPCIPTNYGGTGTGVCVDIVYDANGGTGNPPTSPVVCVYGQPCPAPENTYTYTGKSFTHWKRTIDGSNTHLSFPGPGQDILGGLVSSTVEGAGKITLSAQWGNPSMYTVMLNNTDMGGIGGTTEVYTTEGLVFYSDAAGTTAIKGIRVPTKQNATYLGHYTTSDVQCIGQSGEFTFASGCEVTSDTRWYARYQCNTGWTDAGTVINEICAKNITVNLNNLYATKKGTEILYARGGSGQVFVDEGYTDILRAITIPENVPVVSFDANGGTVDLSSFAEDPNIARVAENSLTFLPVAFTGFYSEKSGGTQYIDATGALTEAGRVAIAKSSENLTWYAQWASVATVAPMPTPVRDGYNFRMWTGSFDNDGQSVTVTASPGQRLSVPTSVNLIMYWTPKCNEITLNPTSGTAGAVTTLYKLTDSDSWYTDSNCSAPLQDLSSVIPSRVGYLFRGFYPQSYDKEYIRDIADDYETLIPAVITPDMIIPGWNTTSANVLYASWVKDCEVPNNGTCSVAIGPGGQMVDYTTSCDEGYTLGNADTATPVCTANGYTCSAGQYLNGATCATCMAGSYCTGGTYTYNGEIQGQAACPSGYSNSDAGSDSESDCYRACTTSDVVNATAVSGRVYSDGTNACDATGCVTGYSVKPGVDLNSTIGTVVGDDSTYDSSAMTFGVDYGDLGTITGHAQCSTLAGVWDSGREGQVSTADSLPDSSGSYCWCSLDGYTPSGGVTQSLSGHWVFGIDFADAGVCADDCALYCAAGLRYTGPTQLALFGSLPATAQCVPNTYTVSYAGNGNTGGAAPTSPKSCTYDGTCTAPANTYTKTGYTFAGWTCTGGGESCNGDVIAAGGSLKNVSTGAAITLTAKWTINSYTCPAGKYLPKGATACETCSAGSYCIGGTFTYSTAAAQGQSACPSGYGNSDAGSDSESDCYRSCTTSDVVNATAVSGRVYSDGTNACDATGCENGYSVKSGVDLNSTIGTVVADDYTSNSSAMTFGVDYGNLGSITGRAQCSSLDSDTVGSFSPTLPDSSGANCYCKLDGYTPVGATSQALSSPWMYRWAAYAGLEDLCISDCARACALELLKAPSSMRSALFGSVPSTAQCVPNTYTVSYAGNGGTGDAPTSPTSCTYDGTCTAPANTYTKTGYTFAGWTCTGGGNSCNGNVIAAGGSLKNVSTGTAITLTAKWTANTYTVSYAGNGNTGGSAPTSPTICTYDGTCTAPANTYTKTGYTFAGWTCTGGGNSCNGNVIAAGGSLKNVSTGSAITLTAKWTANTYTVSYAGNGNTGGSAPTAPKSCTYDGTCTAPANTYTKTGYTFAGWTCTGGGNSCNGNVIAAGGSLKNVSTGSAITLTAKWTANTYTVSYAGNGNTGGSAPTSPTSCTYDGTCTAPANTYTKTGYEFIGWACTGGGESCNGNVIAAGGSLKNVSTGTAITLTAQWGQNTFTCPAGKYLPKGATVCETCSAGSYCIGGTFTYSTAAAQGQSACPSGYGNSDAGSDSESDCYRACTTSDVVNATAVSGRVYSDGTNACDATGCVTGYSVKPGDLNTIIGTVGGDDSTYDSSAMTFGVDYGDLGTITGHAQCSTQVGTGIWNGASSADQVTTRDSLPDSSGQYCWCSLDGYTPSGGVTQSLSGPWVFSTGDFGAGLCADECAGNCASYLRYRGSMRFVFRAAVFGSLPATAQCVPNTYTVSYAGNGNTGGSAPTSPKSCTYDSDCTAPANTYTKTGYTFAGWTCTGGGDSCNGNVIAAGGSLKNVSTGTAITLTAKWTANTYTVSYAGNGNTGGSAPTSPKSCTYDSDCTAPANTYTKTGYTFAGWTCTGGGDSCNGNVIAAGGSLKNVSTGTAITLTAKWTANTYTVSYAGNGNTGGSAPTSPKSCTYDGTCTAPANTYTKTGYTFAGWTCTGGGDSCNGNVIAAGGSLKNVSTGTAITLTAKWTANTYTVSYAGNGNTGGSAPTSPKSCTYGSACTAPANTYTKTGYTFAGWTCTGGGDSCNGNVIAAGGSLKNVSTGSAITLTAKWTANTYTVSYAGNGNTGGSAPTAPKSCTYDGTCTAPANTYTKTGYTFAGWTCTGGGNSCNGNVIAAGGSLKNVSTGAAITLTAKWTVNSYTCSAGQYLNGATCATCMAGSYCTGGTYTYNGEIQGQAACPSGYSNSDSGSDSASDCYRSCTASDVSNATTVSGRVYSDGTNACDATGCENGYNVKSGLDLNSTIGTVVADDYTSNSSAMTFGVDYGNLGSITGRAQCSSLDSDTVGSFSPTLPDSSGANCYCKLDGYTPVGATSQALSSPWMYLWAAYAGLEDLCISDCARACALELLKAPSSMRSALFGSVSSTAQCVPNTYTVSYAGNGGSGSAPTSPTSCTYDSDCTAPANTYTKTGYTFAGWTCTGGGESCNGDVIAAGGSLKNVSTGSAITLTAKWTANVYKVTLDKQSGTGGTAEYYYQYKTKGNCYYYTTSDLTVCTDSSNGGTIAVPTRTGYTFGGYYTGTNGSGTQYVTAAGVTTGSLYSNVAADTTLYAKWTANTYTVSFNANGGTGGQSANVTATYDAAMPAISTTAPSRTGYTFVGWYDNADYAFGTQYYSETGASARTWNKTANTTLYAGWTENGYDCKAGEYLNVTACKVCEAGYYCPNGAMTYTYNGEIQGRSSCPSGYADGGTGARAQAQCAMNVPGGKYVANKNASSATDCLCGTYKAAHTVNYGQISSCITTDAGYYAAAGASKQTQASLGYYAAAGACEQTKVNAGCYADTAGSSTACPKSCASLGGGLYTKSDAGSDAAEDCYITTTGGYYIANLMDAEETKCEADYYCPAITLTYPNVGGRELCPDPKVAGNVETVADFAWLSTACPDANVGNTTIKSVAMISYGNTGLSAITQCRVQYTVDTPCAQFVIEGVRYNNEKYATTSGNRHSQKLNAGYYYTQRYNSTYCDGTGNEKRAMLYKAAAKCPANSYCPGGTVPKCNAGTYAETWGATSCTALGSFYTTSVEGATATSACYGETTAGNYISTAGDGEETCIAGSYCPGGIMVNYNSVGGSINCPGGYTAGGTGLKAQSECKISVAGGKYVGTANSSTLSTCVAGTSKAAHTVNYGGTSSCDICANWTYSGEGAASCTSCPSVTSGWSKTDSTGTGWKSYTSCKQTQKPANCASGAVTKTATSSTQWGTSTVTTALTANANYYVADTTCSACSGLENGFYPNSAAGNSGGSSVCYTNSLSGKYVATPKANGATDCAAGTAKAEHTVNYGETSTCDVCGENQYSDAGASSCTPCATPYGYGNTGTTAEEHAGRASCKTVCDAGMYVATAGAACENVGAGYYAPGGEVSYGSISKNRGQCPVQLTTIGYGYGANEADDCGRKLHAGDGVVYLRSAKKNPDELALNVRLNITNDNGDSEERVFFGNMTTEEKFMSDGVAKALKINVDDTVYYVHDDSVM